VKPSDGTELLRGSEMTRCANTGREQGSKKFARSPHRRGRARSAEFSWIEFDDSNFFDIPLERI
jgi:hypothetical protein